MEQIATTATPDVALPQAKPEAPISETPSHASLYEMFEVDRSPKVDEIFGKIWQYANEKAEGKDLDSIKLEVIKMKNKFGTAHIGEPPYAKVQRYVSAYYDLKKAENRLNEVSDGL